MIQIAATKIRTASIAPDRFSIFSWPHGVLLVGRPAGRAHGDEGDH
jgi:hypothetical protein